MSIFSEWLEKREAVDSRYKRLQVDINGSPVFISADNKQIIHNDQVIGQVEMTGPQQKPIAMVHRSFQDVQREIQAALDTHLGDIQQQRWPTPQDYDDNQKKGSDYRGPNIIPPLGYRSNQRKADIRR